MRRLVLPLAPLLAFAGCADPVSCEALDALQDEAGLRTCAAAAPVEDAPLTFAAPGGAPSRFGEHPPEQRDFPDGTRLSAQPWGLWWSTPAGDPDAERVADRFRRASVHSDSVGAVVAAAVAPDGSRYAAGLADGRLLIRSADHRDQAVGRVDEGTYTIGSVTAPNAAVSLAFSADGRLLVSGDRLGGVVAWDAETGERRWSAAVEGGTPRVAVAPEGDLVAAGATDKAARVWDAKAGAPIAVWTHPRFVQGVAFTPDGGHLGVWLSEDYAPIQTTNTPGRRTATTGGTTSPPAVAVWRLP